MTLNFFYLKEDSLLKECGWLWNDNYVTLRPPLCLSGGVYGWSEGILGIWDALAIQLFIVRTYGRCVHETILAPVFITWFNAQHFYSLSLL